PAVVAPSKTQLAVPIRAICALPLVPAPPTTTPAAPAVSEVAVMIAFEGAPVSFASLLTAVPVVVSFVTSIATALVARSIPPEKVRAVEQEAERLSERSVDRSPPPLRHVPAVICRPVPTTDALFGDAESVIVRSEARSPPPLRAAPLVSTWRPVPTTEALLGDAESVTVRSEARSPPPLRAAPLVRTWRPVPTTAVDTGDSAI